MWSSRPSSFPLAAVANGVSSICFAGDTFFTSLFGTCAVVAIGFAEDDEIALAGATQTLTAAQALWLNSLGDRATVEGAASVLSEKDFDAAYLLNFDITKGEFTYTFKITGINVATDGVKVDVTLVRNGETNGAINGTLNFYGAATLEAFMAGATKLGDASITNASFAGGETATATIPLEGETPLDFFNAKIEEK